METNPILLLIFAALLLLHPALSLETKVIKQGDVLNSSSFLVSPRGIFTLGFFNSSEANRIYLGIWYNNSDGSSGKKVWVANPDKPMNDSSFLTLDTNGILKLTIAGGSNPIELNTDQGSKNSTAVLLDSGNFVLNDEIEKRILWQSFDYPTDTLLPGMKLGQNHKTGHNWTLTSWVNEDYYYSGSFTLSWVPSGESNSGGQLTIKRRGEPYWESGPLNNQSFEFMKAPTDPFALYQYNLSYVSNQNESYFTFSNINRNQNYSMWVLNPGGTFADGVYSTSRIFTPLFCYGYQTEDGCVNQTPPKCRSRSQKFELRSAYFTVGPNKVEENQSLSIGDCMAMCWSDCGCKGFNHYPSSLGETCDIWSGDMKYQQDVSGNAVKKYMLVSEAANKKGQWWIWTIVAIAIGLISILLGLFCFLRRRKDKEKKLEEEFLRGLEDSDGSNGANEADKHKDARDLNIFSFVSILEATNSFAQENKLGQGGFGPVYKGKLLDGREIAVKRLSRSSGQGLTEFKNELILITKLQHMNLVRVLGCCIKGEEKMLIYEYMPNKSLDFFLFDPMRRAELDWRKRFNIIEGVAQGLLYLHKYSRLRVIHRDLKASNILLDGNMNPKISDFGMARIFGQNELEANTNRVVGTYGYMSPEYAMEGNFSVKSDVFSFGVLILEIVSGRRNNNFYHLDGPLNLIGYAWELWKDGRQIELIDSTLTDSCPLHQWSRCVHVGLLCVQEGATDRPEMSEVISMLSNEMPLPTPKQPAFFTGKGESKANSRKQKQTEYSKNGLSITTMTAR